MMVNLFTKKTLFGVFLGQVLSLFITSTGFSSSVVAKRGINAPTSQSLANYVLLAIFYCIILISRKKGMKAKWYYYLLLGIIDVDANYLVVKAYQYTSLTSVMLLDCWSIPSVIIFTWLFLKTKYRTKKIAGVVICVVGLVLVIFSDVHASDRSQSGSRPIKVDLLVIAGATLYAVCNVSKKTILYLFVDNQRLILGDELMIFVREFFVKKADQVELLAIVSGIQIGVLEREELKAIHWSSRAVLPYAGFAAAMFLFYSGVPILLKISGSTMLNLSLLTSDMWSVLIRTFVYHEKVDWMYFVAFAAVAFGLVVYSAFDKEVKEPHEDAADYPEQNKHIDEEAGTAATVKLNTLQSIDEEAVVAGSVKLKTPSRASNDSGRFQDPIE